MIRHITAFFLTLMLFAGCSDKNGNLIPLFTIEDDLQLGAQLQAEIAANPDDYPVLDETEYAAAYAYLQGLCDQIIETGEVSYADEFVWKVHIIDDSILNAFAAPGGYMYFYTGLIKYLDTEDDLMGVMGHEIAHADQRHSVQQMQKAYGIQVLLSIALGQSPSQLTEILAGLAGQSALLKFSRDDESEADEFSVEYLAQTPYKCDGAASFFEKITAAGGSSGPTFLSTHPNPADRVKDIRTKASEIGCDTTFYDPASYADFKAMLP